MRSVPWGTKAFLIATFGWLCGGGGRRCQVPQAADMADQGAAFTLSRPAKLDGLVHWCAMPGAAWLQTNASTSGRTRKAFANATFLEDGVHRGAAQIGYNWQPR